jgi:hypothetical protein
LARYESTAPVAARVKHWQELELIMFWR